MMGEHSKKLGVKSTRKSKVSTQRLKDLTEVMKCLESIKKEAVSNAPNLTMITDSVMSAISNLKPHVQ